MDGDFHSYRERVREASDLVSYLSEKTGAHGRGRGRIVFFRSPLRSEKDASFAVYPHQQSWFDYGAQEGGDIFRLVQLIEGVKFVDALNLLADRAGIPKMFNGGGGEEVPEHIQEEIKMLVERRRVAYIRTVAQAYYHQRLMCDYPTVLAWLKSNYGYSDEILKEEQIGFSDGKVLDYLVEKRGFKEAHCWQTGLFHVTARKSTPVHEHFEGRIVFPYWYAGDVVYAIGRRFEGITSDDDYNKGKYSKLLVKNERRKFVSQYVRNDHLWGEYAARRKADEGIITEGVADAVAAKQHGFLVCSPVTTRFQKADIDRVCSRIAENWKRPFVINDNEAPRPSPMDPTKMIQPGLDGARDMCTELVKRGADPRLVILPRPEGIDKVDLCDFLRDEGAEPLKKVMGETKPFLQWLIEEIPADVDPELLDENLEPIFELVSYQSELARQGYIQRICRRFSLRKVTVRNRIGEWVKRHERTDGQPGDDEQEERDRVVPKRGAEESTSGDERTTDAPQVRVPKPLDSGSGLRTHPSERQEQCAKEAEDFLEEDEDEKEEEAPCGGPGDGGGGAGAGGNGTGGGPPQRPDNLPPHTAQIRESKNRFYYVRIAKKKLRVSNFVIRPKHRVKTDAGTLLHAAIDTVNGERHENVLFPENTFQSKRTLIAALSRTDAFLAWGGNDQNVAALAEHLDDFGVEEKLGCHEVGYFETPQGRRYVAPDCILGPTGIIESEAADVVYTPTRHGLMHRIFRLRRTAEVDDARAAKLLGRVLPKLFILNEERVIAPLIGWFTAAIVAPFLRKRLGHFPSLWVWGSPGGGKSTLIANVFWPMFAGVTCEPSSCTDTFFVMINNADSTSSVPIFMDEYKSDIARDQRDRIHRLLRKGYICENEERGRQDRTIDNYKIRAPLVIAGEQYTEEAAIQERVIVVSPETTSLTEIRRSAMEDLQGRDLHLLAGSLIRFALGYDLDDALFEARAEFRSKGDMRSLPPRIAHNIIIAMFGEVLFRNWLLHMEQFAHSVKRFGKYRPTIDPYPLIASIYDSDPDETPRHTDGSPKRGRSSFDGFMDRVGLYAHLGMLQDGVHYHASIDDDELKTIAIYVEACREVHLQEVRKTGQEDLTLTTRALKRSAQEIAKNDGYVIDTGRRAPIGLSRRRCVIIDVDKMSDEIGVEIEIDWAKKSMPRGYGH